MIALILVIIIIGLIGVLIGMLLEYTFENINLKSEPEQETIKVIEINDNRTAEDQTEPEDYFKPF
jgi:hypothetical protein